MCSRRAELDAFKGFDLSNSSQIRDQDVRVGHREAHHRGSF